MRGPTEGSACASGGRETRHPRLRESFLWPSPFLDGRACSARHRMRTENGKSGSCRADIKSTAKYVVRPDRPPFWPPSRRTTILPRRLKPTARLATYLLTRRALLRMLRRKSDVKRVFQSRENWSFNLFTTGDLLHTRAGPAEHKQNNDFESRSRRLLPLPRCMRCPNMPCPTAGLMIFDALTTDQCCRRWRRRCAHRHI